MIDLQSRNVRRQARHQRARQRLRGNAARPRLSVFRSLRHIYAQLVDDDQGHTLLAASALGGNLAAAREVGRQIAAAAQARGIARAVFDRGGYLYHGRVRALAEAAREAGLRL